MFSFYCYFIREAPHRFQRSISWKRILFRLMKKWYHRCLSICLLLLFHTRGSSQAPEKVNQPFGTTDNLLTHFEWAKADEEVFMCLWKEVSVIVARLVSNWLTFRLPIQIWFPQADHNLNNTYSFIRLSTSLFLSKAGFCLKLWDEKKKHNILF